MGHLGGQRWAPYARLFRRRRGPARATEARFRKIASQSRPVRAELRRGSQENALAGGSAFARARFPPRWGSPGCAAALLATSVLSEDRVRWGVARNDTIFNGLGRAGGQTGRRGAIDTRNLSGGRQGREISARAQNEGAREMVSPPVGLGGGCRLSTSCVRPPFY